MAYYKYQRHVMPFDHEMFDWVHKPGEKVTYSGIFRCEGCGKEIAHNANVPLPLPNHHQHTLPQGEIRWKLVVWAVMH